MKRWKIEAGYKYFFMFFMVVVLILFSSNFCRADDAMVLPKGRWMIDEAFNYYPSWDKQFNDQGELESLANDYNQELDSRVFRDLEMFDPLLTVPASLGRSIVDFEKNASIFNILVSHAFSDKLTVGIKIPYWTYKNKVKASLDSSSANLAGNPILQDPNLVDPRNAAIVSNYPAFADPSVTFIPTDLLYAVGYSDNEIDQLKATSDDVINLLSTEYGYERFETWSETGIGDIELGFKYKYFENEKWRLALQAGGSLPTGREDDPDNLVDFGFGSGAYGFVLGFQNDFIGIKDFVLNGTVRYTNMLSNKETLRVPDDPDYPITDNKERVDLDQGDILELEFSAGYKLSEGFGLDATYCGFFKEKDSAIGADGEHLPGLEGQTSQTGHTLLIGISYNNLDRFQKNLARVPFQVSLGHWHRFAGKNLNKAQYISFKGVLFF
ncbi:MAG: transporter [bacterium]